MNIAVVFQHYYPEQFRATPICEALVKQGHQVVVYTGLPNYPHGKVPKKYRFFKHRHEEHNGVKIERSFEIGRKPGKIGLALNYISYTMSASFKALFAPLDFDVIFVYSTSPILMAIPALILKMRSGKKIHMYLMDIWPACLSAMNVKPTSLLYRVMAKVSKFVYKHCDTIQYSSKSFVSYMQDVHGIALNPQHYLPQFAESLFNHEPTVLSNPYFTFVFAGNIGFMQSVQTILHSAHALKDKPVKFIILGEGSDFLNCKALANTLNLQNVEFMGQKPVEDMPHYYAQADAMLVTMRDDELVNKTLPGKVQSYMAFAKPILGAINGETQTIIQEANCGFVSPAEDSEALTQNILAFMALSQEERLTMSQNAKSYYNKNYTFEQHFQHLENALFQTAQLK